MRQRADASPAVRIPEEQRNVTVSAYLWYVRKQATNDYGLILGSTADAKAIYMNAAVSGLPAGGADIDTLRQVRAQLVNLLGSPPSSRVYTPLAPPMGILVTGSLFFNGEIVPGEVGPVGRRPQTVWEIHPVSDLQML